MDTKKFLIPSDISMSDLVWIIYERDGYLAIARPLASHGAGGGGGGASRRRRALLVIAGVWACSAAISFAPIYAGWSTLLPARTLHEAAGDLCMAVLRRLVRRSRVHHSLLGHSGRLRTARQPRLRRRIVRHFVLPPARRYGDRPRHHPRRLAR